MVCVRVCVSLNKGAIVSNTNWFSIIKTGRGHTELNPDLADYDSFLGICVAHVR